MANVKREQREQRQQEYRAVTKREIDFQLGRFKYDKQVFYLEGNSTKTWFAVEDIDDRPEITHLSQVTVKNFHTFITSGIMLSIKDKPTVSEIIPIIRQSLYIPFTLDIMLGIITTQQKFEEAKWHDIYPGVLFLGSRLTVLKAVGWENIHPLVRHSIGERFYPAMSFHRYTKENRGLWLPDVVRENHSNYDFSVAVAVAVAV